MDAHRDRTLSDDLLDREIASALDIEPSAKFRAQVRARVATERIHTPWWRSPVWAGASAAMATVVLMAVWLVWNRTPPASDPPRGAAHAPVEATAIPEMATPGTVTPAPPAMRAERRSLAPVRRSAPVLASGPEVLVSPDEVVALRRLVAAITTRQIGAGDVPPFGEESAPLPAIEEIVLEPIALSPLAGLESE